MSGEPVGLFKGETGVSATVPIIRFDRATASRSQASRMVGQVQPMANQMPKPRSAKSSSDSCGQPKWVPLKAYSRQPSITSSARISR
ncbi:hypothetical protein D3C81_1827740 [compost metagenome]